MCFKKEPFPILKILSSLQVFKITETKILIEIQSGNHFHERILNFLFCMDIQRINVFCGEKKLHINQSLKEPIIEIHTI